MIDPKLLKKVQLSEYEILYEIDRICKLKNINYSLAYGTLLGAVRHNGFIPWDDDLDIVMERTDYERFVKCCKSDLSEQFILHNYDTDDKFWLPFTKIRMTATVYRQEIEEYIKPKYEGVWVDIFPIDHVENIHVAKRKLWFIRKVYCIIELRLSKQYQGNLKRSILVLLSRILPLKIWKKIQVRLMTNSHDGKYNMLYCGPYKADKEFLGQISYFPTMPHKFENGIYPIPEDYDTILKKLYGDYMIPPSVDKRVTHAPIAIEL